MTFWSLLAPETHSDHLFRQLTTGGTWLGPFNAICGVSPACLHPLQVGLERDSLGFKVNGDREAKPERVLTGVAR